MKKWSSHFWNNVTENLDAVDGSINGKFCAFKDVVKITKNRFNWVLGDYCSMDHLALAKNKKISFKLFKDLNIGDLGLSESMTIEELLLYIAKETLPIGDTFIQESDLFDWESLIITQSLEEQFWSSDWLKEWDVFVKDHVIKRYKDALKQMNAFEKSNVNEWILVDEGCLDHSIFDYNQWEYTEEFLWYVMEYYGNFHLNRIIFEHFLEWHKLKYSVYHGITYTVEMHRFLYEILRSDRITPKDAFWKVAEASDDHHDINTLHTLIYEMGGYNWGSIDKIIDDAVHIITCLKSDHHFWKWMSRFKQSIWGSDVRYYSAMKDIIWYIKIKKVDISLENIIFYWEKIFFNLYAIPSPVELYIKWIILSIEDHLENEYQEPKVFYKDKKTWSWIVDRIWGNISVLSWKLFLDLFPKIWTFKDGLTTSLRAKFIPDKEVQQDCHDKRKKADVEVLKLLKFAQQFKEQIESSTTAIKNTVHWSSPSFWRKLFLKVVSKKALEEVIQIALLTSQSWKIFALFLLKMTTAVTWEALMWIVWKVTKTGGLQRWWITVWAKRSYKLHLSHEGNKFIYDNVQELSELAELEWRKRHIEAMLDKWGNILSNQEFELYVWMLQEINDAIEKHDIVWIHKKFLDDLEWSASLQSRSIHETLVEMWERER